MIKRPGQNNRLSPLLMEGGGKYTQFVKAGCEMRGHAVGPPRKPLLPAEAEELTQLRELLGSS